MDLSTSAATLISTTASLEAYLSSIPSSSTLYLDLEGKNLCRHGTISLITILLHPEGVLRVLDVLSLGGSAFTTTSKDGKSLKSIFEDPSIPKCFWDLRNDADALWAHYKVGLAGVIDVQLLENASRVGDKTYLWGLEKAIRLDMKLGFTELSRWTCTKGDIKSQMSANVFAIRPVDAKTIQYCTNDAIHLPALHNYYLGRITSDWLAKAKEASARRVDEAHAPTYEPQSSTKTLGPWGPGTGQRVLSLDDALDQLEDYMMEERAKELFEDDDGLEDFLMEERAKELFGDDDDEYYDNGPTSCRDIISDGDYHLYYSD